MNGLFPSTGLNNGTPGALTQQALTKSGSISLPSLPQCEMRRGSGSLPGFAMPSNEQLDKTNVHSEPVRTHTHTRHYVSLKQF